MRTNTLLNIAICAATVVAGLVMVARYYNVPPAPTKQYAITVVDGSSVEECMFLYSGADNKPLYRVGPCQ